MNCSMTGFPLHQQLPELAQTHVHPVSGHAVISSSVVPFSSCLQSFPASGSFPMSQFFTSVGQSIAVSASASVFPMNIQDWFPLQLPGLILHSKGLSRVFSSATVQKHQFFSAQLSFDPISPWISASAMLVPWKKSYDKPRQHIKMKRHYFADKGLSSQSYAFSNSHVWIWELDHKESWVPKNWCFWTVMLEKTVRVP